ncbi:YeeE/YedE thiosulfate transporter family protein [Pyrobaculum aerophilum]|uniref:Uncharacterized protein n=1 Tax=Pyrobaculum aerophilum TaxID=13773 RepID=A0A371QY71_9CREN|nr:YeeE/YedE thiosulfate transporter family protein [Pyrobaculum aerophilum]RFA95641.1 hypothetical protein CGL52_12655 [Pyrobaculum aerophilum]RFA96328.1 hypothetical protein CGL51_05050 [Pyrobaculum aerophilum]
MKIQGYILLASLLTASVILISKGHWLQGTGILFGVAYGVVIQRSRICFATAFYGNPYLFRGILLGLLVASISAYFLVKAGYAPHPVAFGINVLIGSILFGITMPFVGGCMLGTIYRVGTGIATSSAAFLGILAGNLIGPLLVWDLTRLLQSPTAGFTIVTSVGPEAALIINIAVIAALFYYTHKTVAITISMPRLKEPWPAWFGGLLLGIVFTVQFATWGLFVTQLPLARAMLYSLNALSGDSLSLAWREGVTPGSSWVRDNLLIPPYDDPLFYLIMGVLAGSMIAALLSGEYQFFRHYGERKILVRHFIAGVIMGISVWIAVGCNVSGFYTAVATLRPEVGWMFALGLFVGARIGLRIFQKFY